MLHIRLKLNPFLTYIMDVPCTCQCCHTRYVLSYGYFKPDQILQLFLPAKTIYHFFCKEYFAPSSMYSWSISHILEHEFFCLGRLGSQGSKGKKVDLRNSEQLLRVVFSTFGGQKFFFKFCQKHCSIRTKKLYKIK